MNFYCHVCNNYTPFVRELCHCDLLADIIAVLMPICRPLSLLYVSRKKKKTDDSLADAEGLY